MATNALELLNLFLNHRRVCDEWEEIFYDIVPRKFQPQFGILNTQLQTKVHSMRETLKTLIDVVVSCSKNFDDAREKILAKLGNCEHRALQDAMLGCSKSPQLKRLWFGQIPKCAEPFFGRVDALYRLRQMYESHNSFDIVICGLAGMGKPTLVSKFLHDHKENSPSINAAWLNCESESNFFKSCVSFGKEIEKGNGFKSALTSKSTSMLTVMEALIDTCTELHERFAGKLIVVLDSCHARVASEFVSSRPKFLDQCQKFVKIIIISRSQHACLVKVANCIKVQSMTPKDSLNYVKSLFNIPDEQDDSCDSTWVKFCAKFYHCPKLLSNVASIIYTRIQTGNTLDAPLDAVKEFLKVKIQGMENKTAVFNEDYAETELKNCFSDILKITISEIQSIENNYNAPHALSLLQIMVYVKPTHLSLSLLQDIFSSHQDSIDGRKFEGSLVLLRNLDLIQVTNDPDRVIEVKLLAQNPKVCDPNQSGLMIVEHFLHNVDYHVKSFQPRELRQVVELFSHVIKLSQNNTEWVLDEAVNVIFHLDKHLMRYEILELCDTIYNKFSPSTNPKALELFREFAASLVEFGRFEEGLRVNYEIYEVHVKSEGELSKKRALDKLHAIAGIHLSNNQVPKALQIYQQVLLEREPLYGKSSPKILATRANIANAYIEQRNFDGAKEILQAVRGMQKQDPRLLNESLESSRSLGYCFYKEGDYISAKMYFEEAATTNFSQHKVVAEFNLGRTFIRLGMVKEGLNLLHQVLEKQREWYHEKHTDVQKTMKIIRKYTVPDRDGDQKLEQAPVAADHSLEEFASESSDEISRKLLQSMEGFQEKGRLVSKYTYKYKYKYKYSRKCCTKRNTFDVKEKE